MLAVGLALFVGGAKLALVHGYGSDLPFSDQWAAEGHATYLWLLHGTMDPWSFIYPHGEHTPAITRLIGVGLFQLDGGQWDPRLEMMASVGLLMLAVLVFWQWSREVLDERRCLVAAGALAVLWSLPGAYENYLWGFQTQFVALLTFGAAYLYGTMREERLGASWWVGQLAGVVALFSIASGWLGAVVAGLLAAWRLGHDRRNRWAWGTLIGSVVLAVAGWGLLQRSFYNPAETTGVSWRFVWSLMELWSWPVNGHYAWLVLQFPVAWLLWRVRRDLSAKPQRLLAAWIGWGWLLAAAFAYGRGATMGAIAVRYYDPLTIGVTANAVALAWLWQEASPKMRRWVGAAAGAWLIVAGVGIWQHNRPQEVHDNLDWWRTYHAHEVRAVRAALQSNDAAPLLADPVVRAYLPHYQYTAAVLNDPLMRTGLGPSIAPPLALQIDRARSSAGAGIRGAASRSPDGTREWVVRGGAAGTTWVTKPIVDTGQPVWRFRVKGRLEPGRAELWLETADGQRVEPLQVDAGATDTWHTYNLKREVGPMRLVAHAAPGAEFAFTSPVEVGWLSWLGPKLAAQWWIMLLAGLGCLLIGARMARSRT